MMAVFVGPDDSETCDGCDEAVNNNPYDVEDAPEPGTFECMSRCRHMLQIQGDDVPDDLAPLSWSGDFGFVDAADIADLADVVSLDSLDAAIASSADAVAGMDATEIASLVISEGLDLGELAAEAGLTDEEVRAIRAEMDAQNGE